MTDKEYFVLISFFASKRNGLQKLKLQWVTNKARNRKFLGRSKEETEEVTNQELGGMIMLVDPFEQGNQILNQVEVPVPIGMTYHAPSKSLLVASDYDVYSIKDNRVSTFIHHPLFNNLHDVKTDREGKVYVVSSGSDGILQFDQTGTRLDWSWFATHQGYNISANGGYKKPISLSHDFTRQTIPTSAQTTHVNSVLPLTSKYLLATLFHQGEIVKIATNTKQIVSVIENLHSPHNIRKADSGFVISDTGNNQVLLLDESFNIKTRIVGDYDWVQDAVFLHDSIYLADSNNGRLVRVDLKGNIKNEFNWDPETLKVGGLEVISREDVWHIF